MNADPRMKSYLPYRDGKAPYKAQISGQNVYFAAASLHASSGFHAGVREPCCQLPEKPRHTSDFSVNLKICSTTAASPFGEHKIERDLHKTSAPAQTVKSKSTGLASPSASYWLTSGLRPGGFLPRGD